MIVLRYSAMILLSILLSGCMHHGGDHAAHQAMLERPQSYTRSMANYQIPDATLIDQDGSRLPLPQLLKSSEPYALNFIFTSCTTICPVMSATFFQVQQELGAGSHELQMISISIDPEYDTPSTLKKYAQKYGAGTNWRFLTGDAATIAEVQQSLAGYVSDKMNHRPFTLIKVPNEEKWLRVDGLATGAELVAEYRRMAGQ